MDVADANDNPWATFGFIITLKARHPRLSTDRLSKGLGRRPSVAWVAGAPRTTPTGSALPGTYRNSYCVFDLGRGIGPVAFEARLRAATRRLAKHAALLRSWRRSGGTLAYHVTVHGTAAMGFTIPPSLGIEIGRLGIELGIEALRARQAE